jgi:hypothetical protein
MVIRIAVLSTNARSSDELYQALLNIARVRTHGTRFAVPESHDEITSLQLAEPGSPQSAWFRLSVVENEIFVLARHAQEAITALQLTGFNVLDTRRLVVTPPVDLFGPTIPAYILAEATSHQLLAELSK